MKDDSDSALPFSSRWKAKGRRADDVAEMMVCSVAVAEGPLKEEPQVKTALNKADFRRTGT